MNYPNWGCVCRGGGGGVARSKRHHTFCICCFPLCLAEHFRRRITISKLVKYALVHPRRTSHDEMKCCLPTLFILFFFISASSTRLRGISELKSVLPDINLASRRTHADTPGRVSVSLRWRCVTQGPFFFFLYENTKAQSVRKWEKKICFSLWFFFQDPSRLPFTAPSISSLGSLTGAERSFACACGGDKETESVCLCARRLWQLPLPSARPTRERSATLIWRSTPSARRQERERRKQSSLRGGF